MMFNFLIELESGKFKDIFVIARNKIEAMDKVIRNAIMCETNVKILECVEMV